ncbi:putative HTH-type transcriptional regulator YdeE [Clostridia bacterium]|nr:putative HTH-type transcriptional regulator YdeE [Clostridia bacterium]
MDLLTQLNRAMAYIEAHIDDDLALSDAAAVTGYSPYHFGRLFYYIAGMPLSEYIRKRKLTLAAEELKSGDVKVIDLAVKYGYDSADSFTRAFAKQHGITPTAARQPGVNLTIFLPLTFQIKIKGVHSMNWRIEEREAFEVFGIERMYKNDETELVPELWTETKQNGEQEKLFAATGEIMPQSGEMPLKGICGYCEPGDHIFPYMIGAFLTKKCKTESYKIFKIPKATWAVFRSESLPHFGIAIPELFNRAYSEWLPSSGYEKAIGPDMEIYKLDENGKSYEEVWIPVRKV